MPIIFYIKETKTKFAKQLSLLKGKAIGVNQEINSVVAERQVENSQMEGQTAESPLCALWMYCM
jgi:hypothetical protein